MQQLAQRLKNRLANPLPGKPAQYKMAPPEREGQEPSNLSRVRLAAATILLFEDGGNITIPLILRPQYEGLHSGQISLPGGKIEPEDNNDLTKTALRETKEEIGVGDIEVLGRLSDLFIPPSNFLLSTFVGWVKEYPTFVAQESEVESILFLGLHDLQKQVKEAKFTEVKASSNYHLHVPYIDLQGHILWGATAMVLSEFSVLVEEAKP